MSTNHFRPRARNKSCSGRAALQWSTSATRALDLACSPRDERLPPLRELLSPHSARRCVREEEEYLTVHHDGHWRADADDEVKLASSRVKKKQARQFIIPSRSQSAISGIANLNPRSVQEHALNFAHMYNQVLSTFEEVTIAVE